MLVFTGRFRRAFSKGWRKDPLGFGDRTGKGGRITESTASLCQRQDAELEVSLVRLSMVIINESRMAVSNVASEKVLCMQMKNKEVKMQMQMKKDMFAGEQSEEMPRKRGMLGMQISERGNEKWNV